MSINTSVAVFTPRNPATCVRVLFAFLLHVSEFLNMELRVGFV